MRKRALLLACVVALLGAVPGVAAAAEAEEAPPVPDLSALPAEGPGSVVREGENLVVEAHFEGDVVARAAELEEAGATVLETSVQYQTVALAVAPEDLEAVTEVAGLESVEPSLEPVFYGAEEATADEGAGELEAPTTALTSNGLCEGGSVTSQAMTQLNVAAARGAFGARGAGQTIGVISDSYNVATEAIVGGPIASHAHEDEVNNDLPGPASTCSGQQVPVRVLAEGPASGTDEGRAMLQVIHDLAPHAQLAFATAYSTELEFAKNIERLAAPVSSGGGGANVIVDDVGYFAEPFYQDGPVAVAIRKVTEAGVTYLTAAGNDNLREAGTGNEIASWEREEFKDAECPLAVTATGIGLSSSKACMNFSPTGTDSTFGIAVEPESQLIVDLQWAEPWYGVEADLNAYLLNSKGEVIVAETVRNGSNGSARRQPLALFSWENTTAKSAEVQLVIDRCIQSCNSSASVGAKPRLKFMLMEDGAGVSKTEYPKSESKTGITVGPTIYGHAGAASAITLAAVGYSQSATAPTEPERYSSRGPVTHYFGPVTGTSPAAKLGGSGELVQKPNVTATDCASTTFFATLSSGAWHFCGTSQAAPHAAAIAALMRQTQPLATPGSILAKLESSAIPFTKVNGRPAVGAGMVNAEAAIAAIGGSPVSDPASTVVGAVVVPPTEPRTSTTPAVTESTTTTTKTAGKSSSSGANADKSKPKVKIAGHPKALERTRGSSVVGRFRFTSDENDVTFYCQVDRSARRVCGERFKRRFKIGRHVLKVRAVDSSDGSSSAAASFRFRVQRVGR